MIEWTPPPATVTWTPPEPLSHGGLQYPTITLRAPTAGEVQKATAVRGASALEVALRMISAVSSEQVPYEALQKLPAYMTAQMNDYMDSFTGTPNPGPLDTWLKARADAEKAEASTDASAGQEPVAAGS